MAINYAHTFDQLIKDLEMCHPKKYVVIYDDAVNTATPFFPDVPKKYKVSSVDGVIIEGIAPEELPANASDEEKVEFVNTKCLCYKLNGLDSKPLTVKEVLAKLKRVKDTSLYAAAYDKTYGGLVFITGVEPVSKCKLSDQKIADMICDYGWDPEELGAPFEKSSTSNIYTKDCRQWYNDNVVFVYL